MALVIADKTCFWMSLFRRGKWLESYRWLDGSKYHFKTQSFLQWAYQFPKAKCACFRPKGPERAAIQTRRCAKRAHILCQQCKCYFCISNVKCFGGKPTIY